MKIIVCIFAFVALIMADDTDLQKTLRNSNDQFTAQMFSEVVKANPEKNVVLSAYSVLFPLGQFALASVGASHDEILKGLFLPNDNVTKAVFAYSKSEQRAVKGVELRMANKIYIPQGIKLAPEFAEVSRDVFGSDVQNVNFAQSAQTAALINKWVEDQTNNRIKNLIAADSLDDSTRSVLVNAIYFKGSWKDKFDKERTMDKDFHVSLDKTIKVPTMSGKKNVRYGEIPELDAKMIEIPYEGEQAVMQIILPNKNDGINTVLDKINKDPQVLQKATNSLYQTDVIVSLPKFKVETTTDLKEVLSNMNMKKLFTPEARLENLLESHENLYVSKAVQKAFIEVNEEGAEAAAANAFIATRKERLDTPYFMADKPFYFTLKSNGLVLFNGVFKA